MTQSAKIAVLVVSMRHSDASACTRILNLLGAELPSNLMANNDLFNPTGFGESNDVVSMNNKLLTDVGSRWDETFEFGMNAFSQPALREFNTELSKLLDSSFEKTNCSVMTDPRLARV